MNKKVKEDDGSLDKIAHLIAWRTGIKKRVTVTSKEFKMGKWHWVMEYFIDEDPESSTSLKKQEDNLFFSLMAKEKQNISPPITSFVLHVLRSEESLGTTISTSTSRAYKDSKFAYGRFHCFLIIDTNTFDTATPITFGLEFTDLKFENAKDGKTYSIWNDEYPKNKSNKPLGLKLLESTDKDILINARDGTINAHRHVLKVSSPVFDTMLSGNYVKNISFVVNIDDMSIKACEAMLNFLYDEKKNSELRAHNAELLVAADKYDIVALKKACEASMCENVAANSVFKMLQYAHTKNLQELKNTCLFYLKKMGVIYELQEDYNSFQREAVHEEDRELVILLSKPYFYAQPST